MKFDKVVLIVVGALVVLPAIIAYIWINVSEWFQDPELLWPVITIVFSSIIGIFIAWFINPMIAYKRNADICVGGIPFPVHYGMPVDDGCISGYFSLRNYIIDLLYICLVFVAMGILIYTNGVKYGFTASWFTLFLLIIGIKVLLYDVLKIYTIKFEQEEKQQ